MTTARRFGCWAARLPGYMGASLDLGSDNAKERRHGRQAFHPAHPAGTRLQPGVRVGCTPKVRGKRVRQILLYERRVGDVSGEVGSEAAAALSGRGEAGGG